MLKKFQKILKDSCHEYFVVKGLPIEYDEINKYTNQAIEEGHQITYLSLDEIKVWQEAAAPLQDEWLADLEAEGWPAREMFDEAQRLIAEYHAQ